MTVVTLEPQTYWTIEWIAACEKATADQFRANSGYMRGLVLLHFPARGVNYE
jgi:hypothetical protein